MTDMAWTFGAVFVLAASANWWSRLSDSRRRVELWSKPLAMVALIGVAVAFDPTDQLVRAWFVIALVCSLAGDVFLLDSEHLFVPGLVSFLLAHLAYIALFRQDAAWFPSRRALAATLGIGAAMYVFLWQGGLPTALRVPVAVYVGVIALMAAQAIGRATVLRNGAAVGVALGAGFFMLSDSLLAVNKFVMPLPMSQVWVLTTYYAAQVLIVRHMLASSGSWRRSESTNPEQHGRSAHLHSGR